jgi:hypothetical protein
MRDAGVYSGNPQKNKLLPLPRPTYTEFVNRAKKAKCLDRLDFIYCAPDAHSLPRIDYKAYQRVVYAGGAKPPTDAIYSPLEPRRSSLVPALRAGLDSGAAHVLLARLPGSRPLLRLLRIAREARAVVARRVPLFDHRVRRVQGRHPRRLRRAHHPPPVRKAGAEAAAVGHPTIVYALRRRTSTSCTRARATSSCRRRGAPGSARRTSMPFLASNQIPATFFELCASSQYHGGLVLVGSSRTDSLASRGIESIEISRQDSSSMALRVPARRKKGSEDPVHRVDAPWRPPTPWRTSSSSAAVPHEAPRPLPLFNGASPPGKSGERLATARHRRRFDARRPAGPRHGLVPRHAAPRRRLRVGAAHWHRAPLFCDAKAAAPAFRAPLAAVGAPPHSPAPIGRALVPGRRQGHARGR